MYAFFKDWLLFTSTSWIFNPNQGGYINFISFGGGSVINGAYPVYFLEDIQVHIQGVLKNCTINEPNILYNF